MSGRAMRPSHSRASPCLSVIIATWNGKSLLDTCLSSLRAQAYPDLQIIVVDNGSSDGTAAFVQDRFGEVELVKLPKNVGFSRANNLGIQHARGQYIALLNNDAQPDTFWLRELVAALEANLSVSALRRCCSTTDRTWRTRVGISTPSRGPRGRSAT